MHADVDKSLEYIDYQLGWRWLLPDCNSEDMYFVGWQPEEESILSSSCSADSDNFRKRDVIFVVNADADYFEVMASIESKGAIRDLVFCGNNRSVEKLIHKFDSRFDFVQYALLPSKNSRVVIPLTSVRSALAGLALHTPGSLLKKLQLNIVRVLVMMGYFSIIKKKTVAIGSTKFSPKYPAQIERLKASGDLLEWTDLESCALYLGVAGAERKTVALPVFSNGCRYVIKTANKSTSIKKIAKEIEALTILGKADFSNCVPEIFKSIIFPDSAILIQEYRRKVSATDDWMQDHALVFLGKLSETNRCRSILSLYLRSHVDEMRLGVPDEFLQSFYLLIETLQSNVSNVEVVTHYAHGDFAQWNCSKTQSGFFVFDWEDFDVAGLAFADAFRWITARELLLSGSRNIERASASALRFALLLAKSAGMDHVDIEVHFVIWCLWKMKTYAPDFYFEMAKFTLTARKMSF